MEKDSRFLKIIYKTIDKSGKGRYKDKNILKNGKGDTCQNINRKPEPAANCPGFMPGQYDRDCRERIFINRVFVSGEVPS